MARLEGAQQITLELLSVGCAITFVIHSPSITIVQSNRSKMSGAPLFVAQKCMLLDAAET
jgi:hypothetical protein